MGDLYPSLFRQAQSRNAAHDLPCCFGAVAALLPCFNLKSKFQNRFSLLRLHRRDNLQRSQNLRLLYRRRQSLAIAQHERHRVQPVQRAVRR